MNRTPLLLLVEDSADDRHFFKRALSKIGCRVPLREAVDGQQAVDYLSGMGPFADRIAHPEATHVLLDLKLPRKSGTEILEWIRTKHPSPNLPVIILTSSDNHEDVKKTKEMGVDDYYVKPASFEKLLKVARAIVERWNLGLS